MGSGDGAAVSGGRGARRTWHEDGLPRGGRATTPARYLRAVAGEGRRPVHNGAVTSSLSAPLVLGIETSCDETGVGIVRGHTLLADAVASSVEEHARFGGVVPEVASRAHLEAMVPTIERACETAGRGARATSTRSR